MGAGGEVGDLAARRGQVKANQAQQKNGDQTLDEV
jgi:hypothetical protein